MSVEAMIELPRVDERRAALEGRHGPWTPLFAAFGAGLVYGAALIEWDPAAARDSRRPGT